MSYSTAFYGRVEIEPILADAERAFLAAYPDSLWRADPSTPFLMTAAPPAPRQPDGPCGWKTTDDGSALTWDREEGFSEPEAWMRFLIDEFLAPSGRSRCGDDPRFESFTFDHVCTGTLAAIGEEPLDYWLLHVQGNVVERQVVLRPDNFRLDRVRLEPLEEQGILLQDVIARPGRGREESVRATLDAIEFGSREDFVRGLGELAPALPGGAELSGFLDTLD
ncbi:MAG: hypothetical protein KDC95_09600 [Planctomycetes bacterium]|nr:hypothetical protein [Planctomycetota bacterium]